MKEWLSWINYSVAGMALLLLLAAFFLMVSLDRSTMLPEERPFKAKEPASAFEQPQSSYNAIGEPALELIASPIGLQLPDLRKVLVYHGKNGRPDADPNTTLLNFALTGMPGVTAVTPKSPTYIHYDKRLKRYEFSPNNAETPLWIEIFPDGGQVIVYAKIKDEDGRVIESPSVNANFTLAEKPVVRTDNASWEIGKQRVDGTLLARQKARWYGPDRFFERHGGPEFEHRIDRQRIDFGEGDTLYSVFIQIGDSLVWEDGHWVTAKPGPETLGKPLMMIRKVEDRLINFELWDNEGKAKVVLNILKSPEAAPPANTLQSFKFVGSRTRSQFVFEINKNRVMLSPYDWLLQTDKSWKKLSTVKEIDDYVEGKISGLLFIFEGVEKRDEKQVIVGTLFNKSRSDFQKIEMVMETGAGLTQSPSGNAPSQPPQNPSGHGRVPQGERGLELHPHTRTDTREYQKNSR